MLEKGMNSVFFMVKDIDFVGDDFEGVEDGDFFF